MIKSDCVILSRAAAPLRRRGGGCGHPHAMAVRALAIEERKLGNGGRTCGCNTCGTCRDHPDGVKTLGSLMYAYGR